VDYEGLATELAQKTDAAEKITLADFTGAVLGVPRRVPAWAVEPLRDSPCSNALKDTYDYSCFLARWNEYHRVMTYPPTARRVLPRAVEPLRGSPLAFTVF
jgi:hypothetical protein